jgi:NAD(P)-dependent dehydrogenase (short-subunit alcohol dehydrogenase family)
MFANKVVVLTGAGSGIGRELALQLSAAGARLALSDINRPALDESLAMIVSAPGSIADVHDYTLDVASREAVLALAEEVKRDFGTAHYVINNAGAAVFGTVNHTSIPVRFDRSVGYKRPKFPGAGSCRPWPL